MIAGVVVTLSDDAARQQNTLDLIAARREIELGAFQQMERRIPLTIDSASQSAVQEVTTWLGSLDGVEFVDVVFVHFESEAGAADCSLDQNPDNSERRVLTLQGRTS